MFILHLHSVINKHYHQEHTKSNQ